MYYYNPYLYNATSAAKPSFFKRIFGNFKISSLLDGANKTLNFVNQTIPAIKQVSPMIKNAKTMFKVINAFGSDDKIEEVSPDIEKQIDNEIKIIKKDNNPTFFI